MAGKDGKDSKGKLAESLARSFGTGDSGYEVSEAFAAPERRKSTQASHGSIPQARRLTARMARPTATAARATDGSRASWRRAPRTRSR